MAMTEQERKAKRPQYDRNRARQNQVIIRMSDDEKEQIRLNAETAGMSVSEYLISLGTDKKKIKVTKKADCAPEVIEQMRNISKHLNAITTFINKNAGNDNWDKSYVDKTKSNITQALQEVLDIRKEWS